MSRKRLRIWFAGAAVLTAAPFVCVRSVVGAASQTSQPKSAPSKPASAPPAKAAPSTSTTAGQKKPAKSRRRRARGQQKPTTDRIKKIQQALSREGHYSGQATGKWDLATTDAVKSFQQASRLTPTGKLDARTLQKLGFGSEVAGQSAPRPGAAAGPPGAQPR